MKTLPEGIIRSLYGSLGEAFRLPAATGRENWHGALFARSDLGVLNDVQAARPAAAYDALCDRELQALAQLHVDPVRRAIDDALSATLGLPDLSPLREMLAREPGLTGQPTVIHQPKAGKNQAGVSSHAS